MRPDQLRNMRRMREEAAQRAHRAYWAGVVQMISSGKGDIPRPDIAPSGADQQMALNTVKRLVRDVEAEPAGRADGVRGEKVDRLLAGIGWLIFVERIGRLDELEYAALTPSRLWELSMVSPEDLQARVAALSGSSVEVAS